MAITENERVLKRIIKTKKNILETLTNTGGIVYSACVKAKITRSTFYKWINEDGVFADAVTDIKEQQKDFCESQILKKMKSGDTTMLIFYAKTQMKDRGYSDRREITGKDGTELFKPVEVEVDLTRFTDEERKILIAIGEKALNEQKG